MISTLFKIKLLSTAMRYKRVSDIEPYIYSYKNQVGHSVPAQTNQPKRNVRECHFHK